MTSYLGLMGWQLGAAGPIERITMNTNVSPKTAELGTPALKQEKPKEPPAWTKDDQSHDKKRLEQGGEK